MKEYQITPRDVLFFRDARPMGGSSAGSGADWPLPSVLHAALLSALHDRWPEGVPEEGRHTHLTRREKKKFGTADAAEADTRFRFGDLRALGPFPMLNDSLHLPTPADLVQGGIMAPVARFGSDNLPAPLKYPVANPAPPSKENPYPWMTLAEFAKYLSGEANVETVKSEKLYTSEARPGVGIDPETHANEESLFYQAEYLRLREGVSLALAAEANVGRNGTTRSLLGELVPDTEAGHLILGGQRGTARIEATGGELEARLERCLPPPEATGKLIKWVLLTPALFDAGWRPDWVGEDGGVQLLARLDRSDFPTRKAWREAMKARQDDLRIGARLVAARVPKPVVASGWKLAKEADHAGGKAKPTRLLVPAGSVYYFECDDADQAASLVRELHLQVKSQRLGNQGFGLGVCGTWD